MSSLILFYVTLPDSSTGERMAKTLIESNLIACANILAPHKSLYIWQGATHESHEQIMILKTQKSLAAQVEAELIKLHPYDTPCILQIPVDKANTDFEKWVQANTSH